MTTYLGADLGFGDCKIVYGTDREITQLYKFNSVIGVVNTSQYVNDPRIMSYRGGSYYVGKMALTLETSRIIDVITYEKLELFSPLFIKYIIDNLKEVPDVIVCGLSIAQISHSGHYREAIQEYLVSECKLPIKKVAIIPQGIGGKLAFDKYGLNFPNLNQSFSDYSNYIGIDIGFGIKLN